MTPLPMTETNQSSTSPAILRNLRVASPCSADWGEMVGNEKSRFCPSCRKNVYNLSTMTTTEAASLIQEKEGRLCVRYYQRTDGTVLTQDCPVGIARIHRRILRTFAACIVGIVAVLSAFGEFFRLSNDQQPWIIGRLQVWASRFAPSVSTPEAKLGAIVPPPVDQTVPSPTQPSMPVIMGDMRVSSEAR
jgi:hypothetical protein